MHDQALETIMVRATSASEIVRGLAQELHAEGASVPQIAAALMTVAIQVMETATDKTQTAGWLADVATGYDRAR